jgi:hypothetical protein
MPSIGHAYTATLLSCEYLDRNHLAYSYGAQLVVCLLGSKREPVLYITSVDVFTVRQYSSQNAKKGLLTEDEETSTTELTKREAAPTVGKVWKSRSIWETVHYATNDPTTL